MRRRSLLKAFVLGAAVAFPKVSLGLKEGEGWERGAPSITEMVAKTLRSRQPELTRNLTRAPGFNYGLTPEKTPGRCD